jgi:FlaA1/EpsC-like NDP-sugar epimerase
MALPIVGGIFAWFVGLTTSAFTSFTTFLIGKMLYEKAVRYALITAFLVAAAALTVTTSLMLKATILGIQIAMPNSLGMVTYFLPSNINQIFGAIITIRLSTLLYRWTVNTMSAYVPNNPRHGLML